MECYGFYFSLLLSALTVMRASSSNNDCETNAMTRCTEHLKVLINNKDLGFAETKQELHMLCPRMLDGLKCIDNFTRRCLRSDDRHYFTKLYAGTNEVILDLCQEGPYQDTFLKYAPCMHTVQEGYEDCAVQYQKKIREINDEQPERGKTTEQESLRKVKELCCAFQDYILCSQEVVRKKCGTDVANFTKNFLDRMAGPLIKGHCRNYGECSSVASHLFHPVLYTFLMTGSLLAVLMFV